MGQPAALWGQVDYDGFINSIWVEANVNCLGPVPPLALTSKY